MGRGGAKRRKTKGLQPVPRSYIQRLIDKIDSMNYGHAIFGELTGQEQKLRNKALIALLYLSARRISELVGRKYIYTRGPRKGEVDLYEGVKVGDFKFGTVGHRRVLLLHCRILKKGSAKTRLKEEYADINIKVEDSFCSYVLEWLRYLKQKGYKGRVFNITRQRAWQILHELDSNVWNHWFRHQRLSHLSAAMDPYRLASYARWRDVRPALSYVHAEKISELEGIDKADRLWAE